MNIVSTTTSRRLVLISPRPKEKTKEGYIYCAEPSPDTAEDIMDERIINAILKANGKDINAEATLQSKYNYEQTARILGGRTQGMQLFRDGSYNLCQAYQNGSINDNNIHRTTRNTT